MSAGMALYKKIIPQPLQNYNLLLSRDTMKDKPWKMLCSFSWIGAANPLSANHSLHMLRSCFTSPMACTL